LEMARARERRERRQRIEEQQRRRGYGAVEDAGRSDSDPSDSGSRRDKGTEGFEEVEAPGDTVQGGEDECQIEEFLSRKRARYRLHSHFGLHTHTHTHTSASTMLLEASRSAYVAL
jgi:hypothetical protein